jgi:hypothetical protein
MSGLERAMWDSGRPYTTPLLHIDKLWKEFVQEVSTFIAPLKEQVVLKFYPYLAPTNTREICMSNGVYKKDVPKLAWPPMAAARLPLVGGRYGLSSYGKICWMCCGRWETYKFPTKQLEACRKLIERITKRLCERIIVTNKEAVRIKEEIRLLRRRLEKIRILHYKPVVYKEFWSTMQITGQ